SQRSGAIDRLGRCQHCYGYFGTPRLFTSGGGAAIFVSPRPCAAFADPSAQPVVHSSHENHPPRGGAHVDVQRLRRRRFRPLSIRHSLTSMSATTTPSGSTRSVFVSRMVPSTRPRTTRSSSASTLPVMVVPTQSRS